MDHPRCEIAFGLNRSAGCEPLGARWFTSKEALQRFSQALTPQVGEPARRHGHRTGVNGPVEGLQSNWKMWAFRTATQRGAGGVAFGKDTKQ
jgi:hypothetical protein